MVEIENIVTNEEDVSFEIDKKNLEPNAMAVVKMYVNTSKIEGINARHLEISLKGYSEKQKLSITSEVKEYVKN